MNRGIKFFRPHLILAGFSSIMLGLTSCAGVQYNTAKGTFEPSKDCAPTPTAGIETKKQEYIYSLMFKDKKAAEQAAATDYWNARGKFPPH